ncbi:MAG: TonB-dependent receptor, partial [Chitinophagaceae bacterium]
APTAVPVLKLAAQGNNLGYKRGDLQTSFSSGKWGFAIDGYYADKRNSFMDYTDYHKGIVTTRIDYRFNNKMSLSNSITWMKYFSDMPSGVDSTMFATKQFINPQTFTYRQVDALR